MIAFWALLVLATHAQTPTTVFSQPFNWTTNRIAILPTVNHGLFKVGEPVILVTSNNVSVTVYDLYGRQVYAGVPTTLSLAAGHYFVQCNGDRSQFVVLAADYAGASFLGELGYGGFIEGAQRQQRIQPAWVRTGVACWDYVQATNGIWNWADLDAVIARNPNRKIMVMAVGDGPPSWVQPVNLTASYAAYITALVNRYQGKIAAIEIWNEPYVNKFWNRPDWLTMLAELYTAGRSAIRAVDPSILVLGPSWSSPGVFGGTATLAENGFTSQIDGLSWHDYWAYEVPPDLGNAQSNAVAPGILRRAQLHRDAAGFAGPLYITELGLFGQSALGIPTPPVDTGYTGGLITNAPAWAVGLARAVKCAVLYRAAGAEMIYPHLLTLDDFSLSDQQNALHGWEYGNRGPKPKTSAFLMACYWLEGATLVDYRTMGGQIFLFAWKRPNGTSIVYAWASERQSFTLTNAAAFNITDTYGTVIHPVVLTDQPQLFHTNSPDAAALLRTVMTALPRLNLAPVLGFLGNQTVFKEQPLHFTVPATDPDNDPVTYSAAALPAGAMINSSNGTFSWMPTAGQIGSYPITFNVTDARGLSAAATTLITVLGSSTDGLIGWWKLDETTGLVASDSSGANPGRLQNFGDTSTSGWVAGKAGNALACDGTNDYVEFDSSLLSVTNNFTIAAWIKPRTTPTSLGVFFCLRSKYATSGIRLSVNSHQDLLIEGQTASGWKQIYHALGQIQTNAWQHVVVVYDKSVFAVYLNGAKLAPAYTHPGYWDGDLVMNQIGTTRIGAENGSGTVGFNFNGVIDDVRLYSRTLSPTEVTALYQFAVLLNPPRNLRVSGP